MSIFAGKDPIWTARRGTVSAGLVGHWDSMALSAADRMGNIWYDISGNNNHGTLTNGASFDRIGVNFDGVNDYAGTIASIVLQQQASISFWLIMRSIPAIDAVTVELSSNYNNLNGFIFVQEPNGFVAYISNNPTGVNVTYNGSRFTFAYSLNTPLHFVVNYDRSKGSAVNAVEMWINGVKLNQTQLLNNSVSGNFTNSRLFFGARDGGSVAPFNGILDDLKLYNRILSQSEILRNFNATRARFGV